MNILEDLDARGLIHDTTDRAALAARLADGPVRLYCGFDPTADSLHVGNLVPLLTLRRFQLAGHVPFALAGGSTGMVGDPSGRSSERNLLDAEALANNLACIRPQLEQFLDFGDGADGEGARLVNNFDWTSPVSLLDFLRDVGKHVTVNQMVAKESIKNRIGSGDGISYTEFSYMLLQGFDFMWLNENEGVELQIGGSDQWGNIVLGADLIRRRSGSTAHALTVPLLLKPDGTKYGKTAGGDTMWLAADKMSPYRFYQGWLGTEDGEVRKLLMFLTFRPPQECEEIADAHMENPGDRLGQRTLAADLTRLVHGAEAMKGAIEASEILFSRDADPAKASAAAFDLLAGEVPTTTVESFGGSVLDLLVETALATSRSDAKRALGEGGIYVDGRRVSDLEATLPAQPLAGGHHLFRRGKKKYHLLRSARPSNG
ncbi:MAG: tyrosine--tRNA ligase [Actinomycetia bacterium]|nr:tyrosine--tRNA ligase [Actinomycetes bacterium]MCP4963261.1 tyrosine--tRNA ligase [Actinomycetes bacterium]